MFKWLLHFDSPGINNQILHLTTYEEGFLHTSILSLVNSMQIYHGLSLKENLRWTQET